MSFGSKRAGPPAPRASYDDPLAGEFRIFLYFLWEFLGLPDQTPAQYEIADYMQYGDEDDYSPITGRADIVEAFRGIGKSYVAAGYCLWLMYRDPVNEKILVVSATAKKSQEFVAQCKMVLMGWPLLAHLRPRTDQRDAFDRFDVNGASISQSPSLKAASITGQITGSRATRIVADDIEIPENSKTEESRSRILDNVAEFEAIKVPALVNDDGEVVRPAGDVLFLGTPQTAESIYVRLVKDKAHKCFCVPARFPTPEERTKYVIKLANGTDYDILAPFIRARLDASPLSAGKPVDPKRFSEDDLIAREAKTSRSNFRLQYMLDTTLSDAERYPLKQNDLIVFNVNKDKAPMTIQWGRHSDRENIRDDIPNVGFSGDYFMGPLFVDQEWRPYTGSVLFVDPAGRGKDETAWAIVKTINGVLYVVKVDGFNGDVAEAYLRIALDAKLYNVNLVLIEPNFAPGVWIAGFHPVLQRTWPAMRVDRKQGEVPSGDVGGCTVMEAEWAKGRKEERIIDTLEPVMNTHRLVVDEAVAQDDVLMYQLTHITRDRNSLTHDDRLDALAGAVSHFTLHLAMDVDRAAQEQRDDEFMAELDDFVETCRGWPGQFRTGRGRKPWIEVYHS